MNGDGADEAAEAQSAAAGLIAQFVAFAEQRQVEIGDTRFNIKQLPAMQGMRVFRNLRAQVVKTGIVQKIAYLEDDSNRLRATFLLIVETIFQLPAEFLEALQHDLFEFVTFQNANAVSPQPLRGAEEMAFRNLDMVDIEEVLLRSLCVNFTKPLRKLDSRLFGRRKPAASPPPNPEE